MHTLTLFTWGYWGWGTATEQLIQAVDAVEISRGFKPPLFVDIRLSRSVRAPGFREHAFEHTIGAARYRWLDGLGNLGIRTGGPLQIKDPTAVSTLLELAQACDRLNQRILFFCACEMPGIEGNGCHRATIAGLLLKYANAHDVPIQVVEWPGGEPILAGFDVQLTKAAFDKIRRGASSIPLEEPVSLAEMAAIPWVSLVEVHEKRNKKQPPIPILTGPARYKNGKWYLQVYENLTDMPRREIPQYVQETREDFGFAYRNSFAAETQVRKKSDVKRTKAAPRVAPRSL